jgi:hypothetical protein
MSTFAIDVRSFFHGFAQSTAVFAIWCRLTAAVGMRTFLFCLVWFGLASSFSFKEKYFLAFPNVTGHRATLSLAKLHLLALQIRGA